LLQALGIFTINFTTYIQNIDVFQYNTSALLNSLSHGEWTFATYMHIMYVMF